MLICSGCNDVGSHLHNPSIVLHACDHHEQCSSFFYPYCVKHKQISNIGVHTQLYYMVYGMSCQFYKIKHNTLFVIVKHTQATPQLYVAWRPDDEYPH